MTLEDDDDDEGDDDDGDFFQGPPGFRAPLWHQGPHFHDPFNFEDIFREFNELFSGFGSVMRDVPRFPGIDAPRSWAEGSWGSSLRDAMLKYPDSHLAREQTPSSSRDPGTSGEPRHTDRPSHWRKDSPSPSEEFRQDRALDSEVSSRGLDSILRPQEPASSSIFRSVSVSKVIRPDGTVEERRTVRDGQGNTSTTVTVTRGDEVINSESPQDDIIGHQDSAPGLSPSLPDLSDSHAVLSRILQRWFSGR